MSGSACVPFETDPAALAIAEHLKECLRLMGQDPESEAFQRTPIRVAAFWLRMCSGTQLSPIIRTYSTKFPGLIVSRGIRFTSICEHHLAPFFGTVDIGYIPEATAGTESYSVLGLSKMDFIVEKYALRPQLQERMGEEIASEIDELIHPRGVIVVVSGVHTCKLVEGLRPGVFDYSAIRGIFLTKPEVRAEFLALRNHSGSVL
jgi:GTP cyclohydrolase I